MSKTHVPETGFLRLNQIIGQVEITAEEAARNRENASSIKGSRKSYFPKTPRKEIIPLIPVSRSTWWAGVKSGRFPKPVKLGPRTTVWRVEDILAIGNCE